MGRSLVNRRLRERRQPKRNTKKDNMKKPSPILCPSVNHQNSNTDVESVSQVTAAKPQGNTKDVTTTTLLHQNHQNHNRKFDDGRLSEIFVSPLEKLKILIERRRL